LLILLKLKIESFDDLKNIFAKLILGVGYIHDKGFIHRDLKPENLLLEEDGTPIITDLGLAKRKLEIVKNSGSNGKDVITEGKITGDSGTFEYTAPEVAGGKKYDSKADIWSLGCILHAISNGKVPHEAEYNALETRYLKERNF
jgi:serine/threonine protein kinase